MEVNNRELLRSKRLLRSYSKPLSLQIRFKKDLERLNSNNVRWFSMIKCFSQCILHQIYKNNVAVAFAPCCNVFIIKSYRIAKLKAEHPDIKFKTISNFFPQSRSTNHADIIDCFKCLYAKHSKFRRQNKYLLPRFNICHNISIFTNMPERIIELKFKTLESELASEVNEKQRLRDEIIELKDKNKKNSYQNQQIDDLKNDNAWKMRSLVKKKEELEIRLGEVIKRLKSEKERNESLSEENLRLKQRVGELQQKNFFLEFKPSIPGMKKYLK